MKRTLIKEINKKIGKKVKISGWVHTIRDQGSIKFIILRDITGFIQVVVTKEIKATFETAIFLKSECVIDVIGLVKKEKQALDGVEIFAEKIKILSEADPKLPISVVEKGAQETDLQKRLNYRWIDLRKSKNTLIFKVWTAMEHAFREYLVKNGYIEIHSPKLMSSPSESSSELFEVKYFNRKAYLAQSPQFYKQMAMASGFEKVFEIGPVFRANLSFTSRHDTEFTSYDMEISFISSHQDVMAEEQKAIAYAIKKIKDLFGKEILKQYKRELIVPKIPFPQLSMKEAKIILKKLGVQSKGSGDLSPEEERSISDFVKQKYNHEFVFITEYPKEVRPFYHMRIETNNNLTKSFDLLWNGLEITTGAQREHRYDILISQAKEKGLGLKSIQYYLDFFKYGCPPHGGLGLGPTRMLMKIFNISNVREVTFLYRGVKRLTP